MTYTPINPQKPGLWIFQSMFWIALRCTNNMTYSVSANTEFWDFRRFWADFSTVETEEEKMRILGKHFIRGFFFVNCMEISWFLNHLIWKNYFLDLIFLLDKLIYACFFLTLFTELLNLNLPAQQSYSHFLLSIK